MANQNSSLGSANGVKFGVFGYCAKAGCSSIQVGYATDDILSSLSSALKRQRFISPFNLPSTTRNNLSNVLLAHPVAGGLTLVMLLLSIIGHSSKASGSSRYHTALLILSFLTSLVTLLAFLVDILIFVPNLDWGTYVTLAATILNAGATLALCVSQRRLKTRNAMRSRIAENDDYQPAQTQQDEPEKATATLPKFAQFEESPPYKHSTETEYDMPGMAVSEPTQRLLPAQESVPRIAYNVSEQVSPNPTQVAPRYGYMQVEEQARQHPMPTRGPRPAQRYGPGRVVSGPRPMPAMPIEPAYVANEPWLAQEGEQDLRHVQPPQSPSTLSNSSHFTSVSQRAVNPRWQANRSGMGVDARGSRPADARWQRRPEPPSILAGNPDFELTTMKASRLPRRNMAAIAR